MTAFHGGGVKLVWQIVAGILIAGVISSASYALWSYLAMRALSEQLAKDTQKVKLESENRLAMQRRQAQQREISTRLKPDETCLGVAAGGVGTIVVRRVVNGVPQAVQLLEHSRPVKCVGDHRVE